MRLLQENQINKMQFAILNNPTALTFKRNISMCIYPTINEIVQIISSNKCHYHKIIKKKWPDFESHLNQFYGTDFKERLFNFINPECRKSCMHCNGPDVSFLEITTGYRKYCSRQCLNASEFIKDKQKKFFNNLEKVKKSREKYRDTCLKRYGVSNPNKNKSVRDKIKKTCLKKYGHENAFSSPEVQERQKKTMIEKYGVPSNLLRCLQHRKSKVCGDWLNSINPNMIHEYYVKELGIVLDGYDLKTNTAYEFHGDYWHGNPNKYNPNEFNPHLNKTFGELYENTLRREKDIISAGYNLVSIWELDYYASIKA